MDWGKWFERGRQLADQHPADDESDWRLTGQDAYLRGRELRWTEWFSNQSDWDHDHCSFCWAKFMAVATEDAPLTAGYVTADDEYHWICADCFNDFRESFGWTVAGADGQSH